MADTMRPTGSFIYVPSALEACRRRMLDDHRALYRENRK
jgi:hypothetical protein